ncbi:MAG: ABC transporter permease [Euryarchaeota archaeon]|nr:ABC transporter permease [Euryarchaeota archaeon]
MNPKVVLWIARKDLMVELRSRHTLSFMLLFSSLSVVFFARIAGGYVGLAPGIAPGYLWLVFLFTGMLGMGRAFLREKEAGTLDALRAMPVSAAEILAGKALYNFLLLFGVQCVVFPLFLVFMDLPVRGSLSLAFAVLTLSNLSFVVLSSAVSTLVLGARAREVLLPVLLMPLLFPLLVLSVSALNRVLSEGAGVLDIESELRLLFAYTGVSSVIALLTSEAALQE